MMRFIMEFNMDNAAFTQYPEGEAARILNHISKRLIAGDVYGNIMDINGNSIGTWDIDAEDNFDKEY